jgi:serine-type D-Ala-D-Ala carboxypeptidase/endopeptidase
MRIAWFGCCVLIVLVGRLAAQDTFTDAEASAIQSFLDEHVGKTNSAIVVGLVDKQGQKILSAGKLDNGTANSVDGDSVFFIGSVTKTFTDLLLLDMVERGEMQLDDPVAKYLPASVKLPTRGGREIRLIDLATHTAGLPGNPDNMRGGGVREEYETYTVEQMYSFLSAFSLSRDPGAEYEYSNVGMALLGHAMARRANATYESLVLERICKPLEMNGTRIVPTPEMRERMAMGHDDAGRPSPPFNLDVYEPAGAVHSTARDLLKYAAAQAGLTQSSLTRPIEASHVVRIRDTRGYPSGGTLFGRTAMCWMDRDALQPPGMELLGHAGGAGSYHAWVGFDLKQRRGVVLLTTANNLLSEAVGWTILQRLPLGPDSTKEFAREMVGIGTALDFDKEKATLRITKVFPRSPAAEAGLTAGLLIQKIGDVATRGKSLEECVGLILGPSGTKVRLEVVDSERNETKAVEVTRQRFVTSNS